MNWHLSLSILPELCVQAERREESVHLIYHGDNAPKGYYSVVILACTLRINGAVGWPHFVFIFWPEGRKPLEADNPNSELNNNIRAFVYQQAEKNP